MTTVHETNINRNMVIACLFSGTPVPIYKIRIQEMRIASYVVYLQTNVKWIINIVVIRIQSWQSIIIFMGYL